MMANTFGLWRKYPHCPSFDPNSFVPSYDLKTVSEAQTDIDKTLCPGSVPSTLKNLTVDLLLDWQNTGSELKYNGEVNRLVQDILRHPDFSVKDLGGFDMACENQKWDERDEKAFRTQL
jgi:hypothetical protein